MNAGARRLLFRWESSRPSGGGCQHPFKISLRFSENAFSTSAWSSDWWTRWAVGD